VPLHLGHHPPGPVSTPRLIPEVTVSDHRLPGRPAHWPLQQVLDLPLQHLIAGKPNGVEEAMLLQVLIDLGASESGIRPEVSAHPTSFIAGHDGLQHLPPGVGAMDVPWPQHSTFAVA
jgi:hypothetical protein